MARPYGYRGWWKQRCWVCGETFFSRRQTATFCGEGCRQVISRWRRAGMPDPSPIKFRTYGRPERTHDPHRPDSPAALADEPTTPPTEEETPAVAEEETPARKSKRERRRERAQEVEQLGQVDTPGLGLAGPSGVPWNPLGIKPNEPGREGGSAEL